MHARDIKAITKNHFQKQIKNIIHVLEIRIRASAWKGQSYASYVVACNEEQLAAVEKYFLSREFNISHHIAFNGQYHIKVRWE